jgi:hypothetical protein
MDEEQHKMELFSLFIVMMIFVVASYFIGVGITNGKFKYKFESFEELDNYCELVELAG